VDAAIRLLHDNDAVKARRVMKAMPEMPKLDVCWLQRTYESK
jgi:hypothetical protein